MRLTALPVSVTLISLIIAMTAAQLGAEPGMMPMPGNLPEPAAPLFRYATDDLWQYLRAGLNYLESPRPLAEPETVPPSYIHPDGRGFGCYGFSPEAYEDVRRLYPYFRPVSWEQILSSPRLYDMANHAFCDWLIKNLRDDIPPTCDRTEIFDAVQQAWNLGLSGFQKGRSVVASRMRRAGEFKGRH